MSAKGISAKFGHFGEFVVDYEPFRTLSTHEPGRRCEGEPRTRTEGFFRGALRFRGERGYVRIEAERAKGTLLLSPPWTCRYGGTGASRAREAEASEDEATLTASSRRRSLAFAAFGPLAEAPKVGFFASNWEGRDGVGINRLTFAGTGTGGFRFDNRLGTAIVDPPAPFAGNARYVRRRHAPDSWTGNLTAPLLGLGRVPLTGPGFVVRMVPRLPEFR